MANMGVSKLILIAPQCEFTIEANKAAASGQSAFQNKVIYSSWKEFYENEPRGFQIATTARDGRGRIAEDFSTTLVKLKEEHPEFGPEDHGLEAQDIENAHHCCSIPTYGDNTSLNLSQATLLALYIFRSVFGGERTKLDGQQKPRAFQKRPNVFPEESLKDWLREMNMDLSKKKINVFTVLRRMLLQNAPSEKEFRMLEIVLQQSTRRMREKKKPTTD